MDAVVLSVFIAVACAVAFLTVRRVAGNLGKSERWWYGWAFTMLVLGPVVAAGVVLSVA